jgi:hypothetical protein
VSELGALRYPDIEDLDSSGEGCFLAILDLLPLPLTVVVFEVSFVRLRALEV